jgi:predicted dehydrogenase
MGNYIMTKPVGVAFIGSGGIAQNRHMPAYKLLEAEGKARIVAVCDVNEDTAKAAAAKYDVPHTFTDYTQMLAMDEIDAVDVCTPNYLHKQPVLDAFAAGKHVICEKPLAMNGIEGAQMVAAGHQAGKKFQVGLNVRFGSSPQAIKRFIEDGKMGEIYYARVHALRRRGAPGWGVFTQKDKQGGGPLIDIGVHMLDLTLWLMGYPKPLAVSGAAYTKFGTREGVIGLMGQWDPKKFTVEDFAAGFVRFRNGATLTLESSFLANLERDEMNTHIFGTEGGVFLNPFDGSSTRIYREESGTLTDSTPVFLPQIGSHEAEIRAFVQAILDDTPVQVPGEQGLMVTRILDALYQSSDTGQEVRLA